MKSRRGKKNPATNRGLSESYVKRRLERDKYVVWRSGFLHMDFSDHYPNVRNKYDKLLTLIEKHHPGHIEELQLMSSVHHGMPDLLAFRDGKFKFIECKFGHEQLRETQRKCIDKLLSMGFDVEVHKIVRPTTKARIVEEDLATKKKVVREKQMRLKRKYK